MAFRISAVLFFLTVFLPGSFAMAQDMRANPDEVTIDSDSALVHSYLDEAAVARREGDIRRQRMLLDRAYDVADSLDVPLLIKTVEKDLGEYYLEASSYDSAETVLRRAVERPSDKEVQTQVLNLLATAYNYQSQYPKAMSTYNQALSLIDSLEGPDKYAAINANKAVIYEKLGNISKAVSLYQKGITFAEAVGDSSFLAKALNNLGKLYYEQSNYEDAETYLNEAISISEEQEFYNTLLLAKHNLAGTERDLGNYDEARNLYQEAWTLHDKVRPDSPPIQLLHNMGMFHVAVSELDEAEEHFRESLNYSQKGGVPDGLFHNFIGLGDVAVARGDYLESTRFYDKAFEVAQKVDSPPFRITASEKLYEAYKKAGNYEQALSYHELAKEVSDSLTEAQQDQQLAMAETELGLRQQQKINDLLQEQQAQQEARIVTQNWLIGVSVLVILVVLVSAIMLYRSNRKREQVNRELKELNEVKDKMIAVIAHDLRSPMTSMQGVFYLLKDEDLEMDEIRKIASELEVTVQQNINMMDNLLSWANSQMKGLEVETETIAAYELVNEVLKNSSFQADHKSIALLNEVDQDLQVKADINLTKLIIRNLVNNAIKFSSEGDSITVIAEENNQDVVFKVKDTGIGIPEEEQEDIFSLQGKSRSGTNNENGSGLGLQLCKEFIEKQNGEIAVESTEGEGTTFIFSLPKG